MRQIGAQTNDFTAAFGRLFYGQKKPHRSGVCVRSKYIVVIAQPGERAIGLDHSHKRTEALPQAADEFEKAHKRLPQRSLTTAALTGQSERVTERVSRRFQRARCLSALQNPGTFPDVAKGPGPCKTLALRNTPKPAPERSTLSFF